jgi:hypothetical protein
MLRQAQHDRLVRSYFGVSLYAIDCTPLAIAALPRRKRDRLRFHRDALIGVFDTR